MPMNPSFPEPRQLETERGRFAVRQFGAGPELVMLHGWPQSSYCWKAVAERLSHHYRVTLPDLRGLGDSERTAGIDPYFKDQLALDVLTLLRHLEIDRYSLVGHDWGGAVAQEMVLAEPDRVDNLALMNISIILNHKGNIAAQNQLNQRGNRPNWYQHFQQVDGLPEGMIPGNEEVWVRCFLNGVPEQAISEYIRCYRIPGTAASGAAFYRTFRSDIKRWANLKGCRFPVNALYLYGRRDPVIIPAFLDHAEECFESLEIKHLNAGHFVPEERPEEVAQALLNFLT